MESIQTNHPVLARAQEFSQEVRRQRELAQEAAAKVDIPLKQEPAIRVTFSQEAQTRLNEEKTHDLNVVQQVRVAERAAAAEERSKAMRDEHQKAVEERVAALDARVERDHIAKDKAVVADKLLADRREAVEKVAKATRKISEASTERAIQQQNLKAAEFIERRNAVDFDRTFVAKTKETSDLLEKQKRAVVVKNMHESRTNDAVAVEQMQKFKKINERVKAETAKATKMYEHIDSMR